MSVVTEQRAPAPQSAFPDKMPGGIALSAAMHLVLGTVFLLGLPTLFRPSAPEEMPIAVSLVAIAPETRATHPNPYTPRPEAKPEPPLADTPPVPEAKPEPPAPAPVPPPSAEAPPAPPPLPEAKPDPPKPAAVPPLPVPGPKPEPAKLDKPEPPRPKEKPEPPQQVAKAETNPDAKKYDPTQFQALLKNLAAQTPMTDPEAPPQKPHPVAVKPSSQPRAPLGAQLTVSEMDLVREQISRCWNVPAGARDAKDLVVEIRVVVDPTGMVEQASIVDQSRANGDPFFRAAAESARRAFFNPMCRPLHLPPEKYAIWKDLVVNFTPRDLL